MRWQREQLETLTTVLDTGTFDAAAQALSITPSAVSQRIKALERDAGRVLVVRSRPIGVTPAGAALVRMARQQAALEAEAARQLGDAGGAAAVPIGVNADSMATWLLPALAATGIPVQLHRDDQDHTADLLADGTVMAAVTSRVVPVPGCITTPLGVMRYRAVASADFVQRWFPGGVQAEALAVAPVIDFDRKDELQSRWLASRTRRTVHPPRCLVPASADFARAVQLGMGWALLPEAQITDDLAALGGDPVDVVLHWQQWDLRTGPLDTLREAVVAAAAKTLR